MQFLSMFVCNKDISEMYCLKKKLMIGPYDRQSKTQNSFRCSKREHNPTHNSPIDNEYQILIVKYFI